MPKIPEGYQQIGLVVPKHLVDGLRAIADSNRRKLTAELTIALEEYLAARKPPGPEPATEKKPKPKK